MADLGDKVGGKILDQVKSTVHDASDRFGSGSSRAFTANENSDPADIVNATLKTADEVYENATGWLNGKIGGRGLGILAGLAVVGVVAFMVGRGSIGGGDISDLEAY